MISSFWDKGETIQAHQTPTWQCILSIYSSIMHDMWNSPVNDEIRAGDIVTDQTMRLFDTVVKKIIECYSQVEILSRSKWDS